MYVLYDIATGEAISQSSQPIDNTNASRAVKETFNYGIWNASSLDFDPVPISKKMSTLSFMGLFTDDEMIGILDAAKTNTQIQLFVMKMEQAEFIDLDYQPTIDGVTALELSGLLAPGRGAEILNG